jgi:type VI protein secretion system component VasK
MQKGVWQLGWVLVVGGVVVLLGLTLSIALYHRESNTFANFASIWGLCVSLIGFGLTIYTLIETQRVAREAQQEIQTATIEAQQKIQEAARQAQEAVTQAQEQTRQMLERVRHPVLRLGRSSGILGANPSNARAGQTRRPRG